MLTPCEWCTPLRRNFSRFPSGWVGVALLMLRATVGALTIAEAVAFLAGMQSPIVLMAAACAAAGGVALLLGVLTPVVSSLIAAEAITLWLTFPAPGLRLLDSRMALFEFVALSALLAILGPGATSIDARLFGLREVAIRDKPEAE
jgi:uncharacterized membrane protein YphA (DoxX/SURF4 family)